MRLSVDRDRIAFHLRRVLVTGCAVAALFVETVPASAAVISVLSPTSVDLGQTFDVSFQVVDATDLNEIQFSVWFDTFVLTLVDTTNTDVDPFNDDVVTEGTFLSEAGSVVTDFGSSVNAEAGSILIRGMRDFSQAVGVSGDGPLFSARFLVNPLALTGPTTITALFDAGQADGLYDTTFVNNLIAYGEDGFAAFEGSVNVLAPPTQVPEPGTLLLLSVGMTASVVNRRRRNRRCV